jgi:hypothetical protein
MAALTVSEMKMRMGTTFHPLQNFLAFRSWQESAMATTTLLNGLTTELQGSISPQYRQIDKRSSI